MAFGCLDVLRVCVPPTCGFYGGVWVFHHFGPYPHHLNASGYPPEPFFVLGFVGGFALVVALWKCLMALLMRADARERADGRHRPQDDVGGGHGP